MKRVLLWSVVVLLLMFAAPALAADADGDVYRTFGGLDSRNLVWIVAQLHLLFGAFVLGVPIFAVIVELTGVMGGDTRYDWLAREFTKLLSAAFSTTAALGGTLAFLLIGLYPAFMTHLGGAMHASFYPYAGLFFAEAFTLYLYYYGWDRLSGREVNMARVKRPAWILTAIVGVGTVVLMFVGGVDRHGFQDKGEAIAVAITEGAEALQKPIETAVEEGEVGALTDEAAWRKRAGEAVLPILLETLKETRPERIAGAFKARTAAAADQARLEAFNAGSDASARHWTNVGLAGLAFLLCMGLACWATSGKAFHLYLGLVLNVVGTAVMMIANSWATYMMSPTGVNATTLEFGGTAWGSVTNPLWNPLNLHRLLANIVFGGFVAGAYAAVRFLGAKTDERRALYDWMGYVGNFVGMLAMITLPFAGYYLGREIYSYSPIMGNNMMGGAFSWTFIFQGVLIGILFIGANYYLWVGMGRIPGSERYRKFTAWYSLVLMICFAVWITPHNLPLSGEERALMGGAQYHPILKYLGLMPAKNAVVNLIILTTFFCFMMYRRANKGALQPFASHGRAAKGVLAGALLAVLGILGWYTADILAIVPEDISVPEENRWVMTVTAWTLVIQMVLAVVVSALTLLNRGKLAQVIYLASTALIVAGFHGVWGFVTMTEANPFLRNLAVVQVLMVLCAMILTGTIDVLLFKNAEEVGEIRWGRTPARSQYALVVVTVAVVQLMCLMGFIRSGLREDWHIYGVLQDTSASAHTPSMAEMAWMAGAITLAFFGLVTFVFWLGSLGDKKKAEAVAA